MPAPQQCPPVPAPRQRPPVPAPRQCPPVPAPRQRPPVPAPRQRISSFHVECDTIYPQVLQLLQFPAKHLGCEESLEIKMLICLSPCLLINA